MSHENFKKMILLPKFRISLLDHVPNIYKYCKFINTTERRKKSQNLFFYSTLTTVLLVWKILKRKNCAIKKQMTNASIWKDILGTNILSTTLRSENRVFLWLWKTTKTTKSTSRIAVAPRFSFTAIFRYL